ncbi:hypothetical protein BJX99DRAFT_241727 [Aspergillus californicus]
MRVQFLLLAAYIFPVLLALVVRVPHIDRRDYDLLPRQTDATTTSTEAPGATVTNGTSIATAAGNSTTPASSTTVPTLNTSTPSEEEDVFNSTTPGALPLEPQITPALGVGGFILIITGAILALIGVRNLWVQVFLSSAFLTSLGVTVLIVYVMNPPVRTAIQGAYLVAIFFTGITFGALGIVFKELAEGLGCLLGGFCTSMWLLSTKPGGLLTATDSKTGFIGAISVGFYAVSFSHYTRPYGLLVSTSIAGGTAVALGIDCYSKAGLKEFWLYLWDLNDDIFPLDTNTYPVTRYIKVELAATVIIAIMGVISQMRLWKVVRERRAREEERRQEEQKQKDEAEAEAVKRLEEDNLKERMEWEAKYGDSGTTESSSSIPELATDSQACAADKGGSSEKDEAIEKQSICDSMVSYRCSDCRAAGDDADITSDATDRSETQGDSKDGANTTVDEKNTVSPKSLVDPTVDDKSSDVTAIVGTETASVYSKRFSLQSRRASVKSGGHNRPVSESQEALITGDDSSSTQGIVDETNDVNSDCHTISGDSQYQAMLDEEQPTKPEENPKDITEEAPGEEQVDNATSQQKTEVEERSDKPVDRAVTLNSAAPQPYLTAEEASVATRKQEASPSTESQKLHEPIPEEGIVKETKPVKDEEKTVLVETSHRNDQAEGETLTLRHADQSDSSQGVPSSTEKTVQEVDPQVEVIAEATKSVEEMKAASVYDEKDLPAKEAQGNQASAFKIKGKSREAPKSDPSSATSPSPEGKPSKTDNQPSKPPKTPEHTNAISKTVARKEKGQDQNQESAIKGKHREGPDPEGLKRPLSKQKPLKRVDYAGSLSAEKTNATSRAEPGQKEEDTTSENQALEPVIKGKSRAAPKLEASQSPPSEEKFSKGIDQLKSLSALKLKEIPPKIKEEPKRLDAVTVEQIPKHTSRIVQSYRMNEWAKHLTNADIPDLEPIQAFEETRPDPAEKEEAVPVKMTELLQTPLNAEQPPAVETRLSNDSHPHDSQTGSQKKKRRSKSPRRLSGLSVGSAHNLSQHLPPAVQPPGNIATTSSPNLLSNVVPVEPAREEPKPKWKGPPPLIAVREDMMRTRLSSLSLPTDSYARHNTSSPTELSPQQVSAFPAFPIPEEGDDMPLSRRRTMLHQQVTPISPTNAPSTAAPPRWSNSGVPSRANSPAVLAAWRESVREDLEERRDPLKLAQSPVSPGPGERSASPFSQLGQRNASSASLNIGEKIADGMQRGDMSELHREAMRRMQAKANKSVNQLP